MDIIVEIQATKRQFCDVTVIWSFQTGLETTICGARDSFRRLFTPNPCFASICCHERAGWGRHNWLCHRARETLGTPLDASHRQWFHQPTSMSVPVCKAFFSCRCETWVNKFISFYSLRVGSTSPRLSRKFHKFAAKFHKACTLVSAPAAVDVFGYVSLTRERKSGWKPLL